MSLRTPAMIETAPTQKMRTTRTILGENFIFRKTTQMGSAKMLASIKIPIPAWKVMTGNSALKPLQSRFRLPIFHRSLIEYRIRAVSKFPERYDKAAFLSHLTSLHLDRTKATAISVVENTRNPTA